MAAHESKCKGLHPSRRVDPDMRQPRAPMESVWLARRYDALAKDRKRIKEWLHASNRDPNDDVREESSEEEVISKDKTRLSSHSTTSLSPAMT